MTLTNTALMLEPKTYPLCKHCEADIINIDEAFVNEAEVGYLREPALYCSEFCRDADNEGDLSAWAGR